MARIERRPSAQQVLDEVTMLTAYLVGNGLADDQNFAYRKEYPDDVIAVEYPSGIPASDYLKSRPYSETYELQLRTRSFNVRMLDSALIQISYSFSQGELQRHRLAFLPSPDLRHFQDDPELYMEEMLYADVVDKGITAVPVRFDFDNRPGVAREQLHPVSHLTLGQYKACRIAATGALTPYDFVEFVLRAFYNTAHKSLTAALPPRRCKGGLTPATIVAAERKYLHVSVPF